MAQRRIASRQSKTFVKRRQNRTILVALLLIISVASWIFVIVRFSNLQALSISSVRVFGADADISGSLQAAAENALTGDYLGIFSRANTLLYPEQSLMAAVSQASPRVQSVKVSREGTNSLTVTVTQKTPSAIVCASLPDWNGTSLSDAVSDSCYFADASGYLFQKAPAVSGSLYNRYYIPSIGDNASSSASILGTYATTSAAFSFLQKAYKAAGDSSIRIEALLIKVGGEYELYAHNPTAAPLAVSTSTPAGGDADTVVVYLNDSRSLLTEISDLSLFWSSMMQTAHKKNQKIMFDYIDVRFGPNVFYRTL